MTPREVYRMLYEASMKAQKLVSGATGIQASRKANIHAVKHTWTTFNQILKELKEA